MIVSHRYRFIFVKTLKTAATSAEIALSKCLGPEDIVARIAPDDETRRSALGYRGAQNDGLPKRSYRVGDWRRYLTRGRRAHYRSHFPADRLRKAVGASVWAGYFKFCIERDPWDKAVSLYYWRTRTASPRPPFGEFLRSEKRRSLSNAHLYTIGGVLVMDRVLRYERLADDLADVRNLLGLPEPLELEIAKGTSRVDRRHYSLLYTPAERTIVDRICAREIALFDYRFIATPPSAAT